MSDTVTLKPSLAFGGTKGNMKVSYSLSLPATNEEFDSFLKAAKRFTGLKKVEIANGLYVEFGRGNTPKGVIEHARKDEHFKDIRDAIDDYFNMPDDETLVYTDSGEVGEMNGTETD